MKRKNKNTVKPIELLNFGLDPAVLWNTDREKEVDIDIFIVATLRKGYSETVISKICEFFGNEMVLSALREYEHRISMELVKAVETHIFHRIMNYAKQPGTSDRYLWSTNTATSVNIIKYVRL